MLKGEGRERGPGGDLLFRRLSGSTIGAEGFHGRVRDGIGCLAPRYGHQACPRNAGGVRRHQAPVERLVPVSCAGCPASTSGLSTWWSSTALERDLVLRRVSRLDAFSGYPVRT